MIFFSCHNKIAYFLKLTISILIEFVQLSVDDSDQISMEEYLDPFTGEKKKKERKKSNPLGLLE